jgi:fido (protein-threonine AMPylation protein)
MYSEERLNRIFDATLFDPALPRNTAWPDAYDLATLVDVAAYDTSSLRARFAKSTAQAQIYDTMLAAFALDGRCPDITPDTARAIESQLPAENVLTVLSRTGAAHRIKNPDFVARRIANAIAAAREFVGATAEAALAPSSEPFTVALVRRVHSAMLRGLTGEEALGVFRTAQISAPGVGFLHAMPEQIEPRLSVLVAWTAARLAELERDREQEQEDAVLGALRLGAVFYREFFLIRPFARANGRTARVLLSVLLKAFTLGPVVLVGADRRAYVNALDQCVPTASGAPGKAGYSALAVLLLLNIDKNNRRLGFAID